MPLLMANRSRPPTKNAFTKPEAGRALPGGRGARVLLPPPPPHPRIPHASRERAQGRSLSAQGRGSGRSSRPRRCGFRFLRCGFRSFTCSPLKIAPRLRHTASILARGFARGGGQIAAFPWPCKSALLLLGRAALSMRDKHGHHCNAFAGL